MAYTNFKQLSFDTLCQRLCENKNTLIIFHARPDADAVGSAFALRDMLCLMGINTICACADEVPERLSFLSEDVQGSVLLDDLATGHERVISLDAASPVQLGSLFERLRKDIDIMIDHHETGTVYADFYVDSKAAATAEIIFEISEWLLENGKIPYVPQRVYNCIYAAISSDTGCFRYANVTPKTHICAAKLIESGIDASDINHKLFNSKTPKQIRAEAFVADRIKTAFGGRVAYATVSKRDRQAQAATLEHFETAIDVVRSVEFVEISFVIKEMDNGDYKASMRSTGKDVAMVAQHFSGGGHIRASGCTVKAPSIARAAELVLEKIGAVYYSEE